LSYGSSPHRHTAAYSKKITANCGLLHSGECVESVILSAHEGNRSTTMRPYFTALGMAMALVGVWATLVTLIA